MALTPFKNGLIIDPPRRYKQAIWELMCRKDEKNLALLQALQWGHDRPEGETFEQRRELQKKLQDEILGPDTD